MGRILNQRVLEGVPSIGWRAGMVDTVLHSGTGAGILPHGITCQEDVAPVAGAFAPLST